MEFFEFLSLQQASDDRSLAVANPDDGLRLRVLSQGRLSPPDSAVPSTELISGFTERDLVLHAHLGSNLQPDTGLKSTPALGAGAVRADSRPLDRYPVAQQYPGSRAVRYGQLSRRDCPRISSSWRNPSLG